MDSTSGLGGASGGASGGGGDGAAERPDPEPREPRVTVLEHTGSASTAVRGARQAAVGSGGGAPPDLLTLFCAPRAGAARAPSPPPPPERAHAHLLTFPAEDGVALPRHALRIRLKLDGGQLPDASPVIFILDLSGSMGEHAGKMLEACQEICADAAGTEGLVHIILFGFTAQHFDAGAPDAIEAMRPYFRDMMGGTVYQRALAAAASVLTAIDVPAHLIFMTDGDSYDETWTHYFDAHVRNRVSCDVWYLPSRWGGGDPYDKLRHMSAEPLDMSKMEDGLSAGDALVKCTKSVCSNVAVKFLVRFRTDADEKGRDVPCGVAPGADEVVLECLLPLGQAPTTVRLQGVHLVGEHAAAGGASLFAPCEVPVLASGDAPSLAPLIIAGAAAADGIAQLAEVMRPPPRGDAAHDSRMGDIHADLVRVARLMREGDPSMLANAQRLLDSALAAAVRGTGRAKRTAARACEKAARALRDATGEKAAAAVRLIHELMDALRTARRASGACAYGECPVTLANHNKDAEPGAVPMLFAGAAGASNLPGETTQAQQLALVNPEQGCLTPAYVMTDQTLSTLQDYDTTAIQGTTNIAFPLMAWGDGALEGFIRGNIVPSLALLGQPALPLGNMAHLLLLTSLARLPNFDKSAHWGLLSWCHAALKHTRVEPAPTLRIAQLDGRLVMFQNGRTAGQLPSTGVAELLGADREVISSVAFTRGGVLVGEHRTVQLDKMPREAGAAVTVRVLASEDNATLQAALKERGEIDPHGRARIYDIVMQYLWGGALHGALAAPGAPPLPGMPCQIWESILASVVVTLLARRLDDGASADDVRPDYEALCGYIKCHAARRALKGAAQTFQTTLLALLAADPALRDCDPEPATEAQLDALYAALPRGDARALLNDLVDPAAQRQRAGVTLSPDTQQQVGDALAREMQPRGASDPYHTEHCPSARKVDALLRQFAAMLELPLDDLADIGQHLSTAPEGVCEQMAAAAAAADGGGRGWIRTAFQLLGVSDASAPLPRAVVARVPLPSGAAAAAKVRSAELCSAMRTRAITTNDATCLGAAVSLTREQHAEWPPSKMLAMLHRVIAAAGDDAAARDDLLRALWPALPSDEALDAAFLNTGAVSAEEVERKSGKPPAVQPTPGSRGFQRRVKGALGAYHDALEQREGRVLGLSTGAPRQFLAVTPFTLLCALHNGCSLEHARTIFFLLKNGGGRLMAVLSNEGNWAVLTMGGHVPRYWYTDFRALRKEDLDEEDCYEQLAHHNTTTVQKHDSAFYVANRPTPEAPLPPYLGARADGIGEYRDEQTPREVGIADLSDALALTLRGAALPDDLAALRAHWES